MLPTLLKNAGFRPRSMLSPTTKVLISNRYPRAVNINLDNRFINVYILQEF